MKALTKTVHEDTLRDKLLDKLSDKHEGLEFGDILEHLDLDLDTVIENHIADLSNDQLLDLI